MTRKDNLITFLIPKFKHTCQSNDMCKCCRFSQNVNGGQYQSTESVNLYAPLAEIIPAFLVLHFCPIQQKYCFFSITFACFFFVKHLISEINFFSGITKKIVKFLSCAFLFCILLILTNYLVSNTVIWVIYIVLAVSSNNGAGKNGTGGKVGKNGTFLILRFSG